LDVLGSIDENPVANSAGFYSQLRGEAAFGFHEFLDPVRTPCFCT
jgi:hypothetical protein